MVFRPREQRRAPEGNITTRPHILNNRAGQQPATPKNNRYHIPQNSTAVDRRHAVALKV